MGVAAEAFMFMDTRTRFTYLAVLIHTHVVGDVKWCKSNHCWLDPQTIWWKRAIWWQELAVFKANWWQNYLVKKKKRICCQVIGGERKLFAPISKSIWMNSSNLTVTIPRPSTEVTCFDDIGQTSWTGHPIIWLLLFGHLTFSTHKGPYDTFIPLVEICNAPLETKKLIFEQLKSEKNLVKMSSLSDRTWNL